MKYCEHVPKRDSTDKQRILSFLAEMKRFLSETTSVTIFVETVSVSKATNDKNGGRNGIKIWDERGRNLSQNN